MCDQLPYNIPDWNLKNLKIKEKIMAYNFIVNTKCLVCNVQAPLV